MRSRGLRVTEHVDGDDDCVANSYGQVQQFFRQNPCSALFRALLDVRDGRVRVVVAIAWVDLPDEALAQEFQRLVDRHATGNITELTKDGVPPTSVRWTGEHYTSVRDGVTVVNAQAEPVGPTAEAVRLAELAAATAVG